MIWWSGSLDLTVCSMVFAGVSLVLKNSVLAWIGLMFSITSIFNQNQDRRSTSSQASNPFQGLMYVVIFRWEQTSLCSVASVSSISRHLRFSVLALTTSCESRVKKVGGRTVYWHDRDLTILSDIQRLIDPSMMKRPTNSQADVPPWWLVTKPQMMMISHWIRPCPADPCFFKTFIARIQRELRL